MFRNITRKLARRHAVKYGLQDIFPGLTPIQQGIVSEQMGLGEIYETVWIAKACADMIALNVAALPLRLENSDGEPVKKGTSSKADNDALSKFHTLRQEPNWKYSGFELQEIQVIHQIFSGNAYTRVVGFGEEPKLDPRELWPLFAQGVTPTTRTDSDSVTPENVIYKDASEDKDWTVKEIIQIQEPNRSSHIEGIPWTAAAKKKLEHILQISDFQNALIQNGAFPTINIHTEQTMNDEQEDQFHESWKKYQTGTKKAGRMLLTASGLSAKMMSFSPSDMELMAAEKLALAEAATIFRVPAELLGAIIDKKNVATYREAFKQFYRMTLIPVGKRHNLEYSRSFWPGGEYEIVVNESAIAALMPEVDDLVKAYWLTPNQKLLLQGMPPSDDKLMDKFYIPGNFIALDDLSGVQENNKEL